MLPTRLDGMTPRSSKVVSQVRDTPSRSDATSVPKGSPAGADVTSRPSLMSSSNSTSAAASSPGIVIVWLVTRHRRRPGSGRLRAVRQAAHRAFPRRGLREPALAGPIGEPESRRVPRRGMPTSLRSQGSPPLDDRPVLAWRARRLRESVGIFLRRRPSIEWLRRDGTRRQGGGR